MKAVSFWIHFPGWETAGGTRHLWWSTSNFQLQLKAVCWRWAGEQSQVLAAGKVPVVSQLETAALVSCGSPQTKGDTFPQYLPGLTAAKMREEGCTARPGVDLDCRWIFSLAGFFLTRADCSGSGVAAASRLVMVGVSGWGSAHILRSAALWEMSWLSGQTRSVIETLLGLCAKISLASSSGMSSVWHLQQTKHQIRKPDSSWAVSQITRSSLHKSVVQWLNGTCALNLFELALALSQFIWQFV